MNEPSMELVVPGTAELVNLDDPTAVALAIDSVRDMERELRSVKAELVSALVHASQKAGSKTLHLEGMSVRVSGGVEWVYDAEAIEEGLREAGMPEERIREIVIETVTHKVAATEAKRAASANPDYAAVIDANKREEEQPNRVSISRKS